MDDPFDHIGEDRSDITRSEDLRVYPVIRSNRNILSSQEVREIH